jgi:hypothetical protein
MIKMSIAGSYTTNALQIDYDHVLIFNNIRVIKYPLKYC